MLFRSLVESLLGAFDPEEFKNDYRHELRAMLEAKLAGQEIARPEPIAPAPVIDLMEALKQSVAQAQKGAEPSKSATAKSPTAKRKRASARG